MHPTVNFFAVLSLLGAVQALLLSLVLVSIRRGNRTANVLLAAFTALAAILITWSGLISMGYGYVFPHLFRINHPLDFVGGPLLYLYVIALTSRRTEWKKKDLLHFIPFGLCLLYLLPYYFQSGEYKLNLRNSSSDVQWYYVRTSLAIAQMLVYLTLAAFVIARYLREHKDKKSSAERPGLLQVKFLVLAFTALWIVAVFRYLSDLRYPAYMRYTNLVLPFGATIIINAMVYLGLRKPGTLIGVDNTSATEPGDQRAKRYEKSTLTSDKSEIYLTRLLTVMETEKTYTDGDLTLPKLATKLSVSAHHLSQIINERLHQNFFDFVNTCRVEEAKRNLVDPAKKHYSILAIAEEVGFNSKSAFNTAFKKQTHMTPSEFRKVPNGNGQDKSIHKLP